MKKLKQVFLIIINLPLLPFWLMLLIYSSYISDINIDDDYFKVKTTQKDITIVLPTEVSVFVAILFYGSLIIHFIK